MVSCFSALFPSKRSNKEREPAAPRRTAITQPAEKEPTAFAHPSHPSCAYCGDWSGPQDALLPSYSSSEVVDTPQSIDLSPLMKQVRHSIHDKIQDLSSELRDLSIKMWDHPEIAFEEYKTHDLFVNYFEKSHADWKVTKHANGLDTAWRAEFEHRPKGYRSSGKLPTVGFNSELDALPGIGHACGHNLIAIGGIAAALSVAEALITHDLPGKVVLLGTPAEEGGGGKVLMLENGAYKGLDACFMIHPAPFSSVGTMLAVQPLTVHYEGQTAHAGASPHEGINAQDACVLAYTNISALRQQLEPSVRVHGIIVGQDWAPNVIPGQGKMIWNVRATTREGLKPVVEKVKHCFEAAALATGCKMKLEPGVAYDDVRSQTTLCSDYQGFMKQEFDQDVSNQAFPASTDFGNITYALPAMHPMYSIPLDNPATQGNHTVGFAAAAKTRRAHELTLEAAEGIAVVGARIVVEGEYRDRVWKEWKEWKASTTK